MSSNILSNLPNTYKYIGTPSNLFHLLHYEFV